MNHMWRKPGSRAPRSRSSTCSRTGCDLDDGHPGDHAMGPGGKCDRPGCKREAGHPGMGARCSSKMPNEDINKIADLLTDDPDIFNEMAVGTGAIAMGPGMGLPVRSRKKKKIVSDDSEDEYKADKVTGQPKKGEMLMGSKEHEDDPA